MSNPCGCRHPKALHIQRSKNCKACRCEYYEDPEREAQAVLHGFFAGYRAGERGALARAGHPSRRAVSRMTRQGRLSQKDTQRP